MRTPRALFRGGDWAVACAAVSPPALLVTPEVLVDGVFRGAEGIAFSGEGRLYVTADRKLWEILSTGETRSVAALGSTVGLAPIGARDVLVAEFGPRVRLRDGPNNDGLILRVSPEGKVDTIVVGLSDPNFIHVRRDRTLLVSDVSPTTSGRSAATGGLSCSRRR